MRRLAALALIAGLALPGGAIAQDQTLADIRQELSVLYVEVQRLKTELSTTGAPLGTALGTASGTGGQGGGPLARVDAIEAELQRLTAKTEELEFRVNSVVTDGTNRIGDLEFRLCELEPDCDIGSLGDTPSLGGVEVTTATPAPTPQVDGSQMAMGERADYERAQEALASGDFRGAADKFAAFNETYPGGPLAISAILGRAAALEGLGEMQPAARAYLEAFSTDPGGDKAPVALYKLGASLAVLGQTNEACITLAEVAVRFPGALAVKDAEAEMLALGCG